MSSLFDLAPGSDEFRVELKRFQAEPKPATGWFHVATIGDHWQRIVGSQLRAIESSGILSVTDRVHVCIAGDDGDFSWPSYVEVISKDQPLEPGENPSLNLLTEYAKQNSPKAVWYIHSKGVSHHPGPTPVYWWRRYMEHFLLGRWRDGLAALTDHDTCGVEWCPPEATESFGNPKEHPDDAGYIGNFWWAKASFLASLPPIPADENRWAAEFRYLSRGNPRAACLHHSGLNLYLTSYRPHHYRATTG